MPFALPTLQMPLTGTATAPGLGTVDALPGVKAGAEAPSSVFAALMGVQVAPLPASSANLPAAALLSSSPIPAALPEGAMASDKAGVVPEGKAKAAASAFNGILGITAKATPSAVSPAAPASTDPASLVVLAAPPNAPINDDHLTQAAGGSDESAEAAEAATVAAINTGVAPVAGERLVLATALPVAVRSSTSVRALDQLLDGILPTAPEATADTGTNNPVALAARIAERPSAPAVLAAVQNTVKPELPALPIPQTQTSPAAIATLAQNKNTAAPQNSMTRTVASPITAEAPQALAPSKADSSTPIEPTPLEPAAPALAAMDSARSGVASTPVLAHPNTQPGLPSLDRHQIQTPVHTPDAPAPQGEPAALSNGKAAPRAVEVLQQRFDLLGIEGNVSITPEAEAKTATPPAHAHSNLVAPASVAALAGHTAASLGHNTTINGPHTETSPATPDGLNASQGGWQSFFSQDQSFGSDAGTDGQPLFMGTPFGENVSASSESATDLGASFGALLSNQSASITVPKTINAAPQMLTPQTVTPDQVAVTIAAAARNGERQITLQLRPASLGRIDIQLSVGRDGGVRARVLAERQETLDVLQHDAQGLETAIQAAGLHAETGGLSFGLKHGDSQNGKGFAGLSGLSNSLLADLEADPTQSRRVSQIRATHDGRALDIQV